MPALNWASKKTPEPIPAALKLESILYPQGAGYPNPVLESHLILGDNLAAMSALLPGYEGRIQLIYADPPFFTNRRYPARVGRGEDSRRPQDWLLAEGYADHWDDIDAYLDMLYPRLALMHRLLTPDGSLYLHLDWHADSYARLLLDEIFGAEHLLNEIVWVYHGPSPIRTAFNRKHDTILLYTKSDTYTFNVDEVRTPYDPNTVKTFESSARAGFGKIPNLERGKVPEDWWYFPVVARLHNERTGYPTQKPEALLERIILASSNPGDLVADFFCGSGTTAVVAQRHHRHFLMADVARRAVHTTRARLAEEAIEPFSIYGVTIPGEVEGESYPRRATVTADQPKVSGHIETGNLRIEVDPAITAALDYWEVDPNWDGRIFRSHSQALRPRRSGTIAAELLIPKKWVGERVAVRFEEITGRQELIVLGSFPEKSGE
jgi:DNA modification methylase